MKESKYTRYSKSPKGRARSRRYEQSQKGKDRRDRYQQSQKGKDRRDRYQKSETGRQEGRIQKRRARNSDVRFDRGDPADRELAKRYLEHAKRKERDIEEVEQLTEVQDASR